MFEHGVLIHYHEIGLKGRNRASFIRRLTENVDGSLSGVAAEKAVAFSSRILVRVPGRAHIDEVCQRVSVLPGVSHAAPVYITSRDMHDVRRAALIAIRECPDAMTFAIDARRSNTDHPVSSAEMNRVIGRHILDSTDLAVDLSNPDVTCRVEVVRGAAYVYSRIWPGVGGLPVGTAGSVVSLLSAGIDSPVATWSLMKRGAVVIGVHFSGRPQTNDASDRLVLRIGERLARCGGLARIYIVPFGDVQREVALAVDSSLRVLLYRRLMVRIAERVAHKEGAKALVTGDSLGQVASQTLDNIAVADDAGRLPILRPLIGLDKNEIAALARRIGTYELSVVAHTDCCALFMSRTPAIRATAEQVRAAEAPLDLERMVAEALGASSSCDYPCPAYDSVR